MNGSLQQWFENCGSPPGLVACGLRQPAGKLICRGIEAGCPAEMMEKTLAQFEHLRAAGFLGDLAPRWSTWSFDQGRVRFIERPDGWLLGLVARHGSAAAHGLDLLSQEFLSFSPGR